MKRFLVLIFIFSLIVYSGCGKKKINRDYIPILKANLVKLQNAVKDQNLAQIDSLLSVKIFDKNQSSDSLVRYIYGADNSFQFVQFGNAEIIYTNEIARIDCYIMDSTSNYDRPLVFFLALEHDLWLFTSFESQSDSDSLKLQ